MSLKCKFGLHSWIGCKCTACGKVRNKQHDWSTDFDKCSICGGTKIIRIRVKILNNSIKGPESFFRKATGHNTSSLFRPALLTCILDQIELGYKDDLNDFNIITKLQFSKIRSAKYKPDAISRISQVLKPVTKGFVFSIFLLVISIFFTSAIVKIGFAQILFGLAIFPVVYAVKGILEMERVSIIIIENIDSDEISFVINDEGFNVLLNVFKARQIDLENFSIKKAESISSVDPTVENVLIKLKGLIEFEKNKSVFKKSCGNEICTLIQDNCQTKSNAIKLLNSFSGKFKSGV